MAGEPDFQSTAEPSLQQLATFLADELFDVDRIKRLENLHRNAHAEGATIAHAAQIQASSALHELKEKLVNDGYEKGRKAVGWVIANIVAHLLGVEAPPELFGPGNLKPQDSAIGKALAGVVIGGIAGETNELVPGDEAAQRFMGMLGHLTIQSWAEGIIVEEFTSLAGVLHPIEEISKLGQDLINGMGLNRLARVAMRPLAHILVATPLEWKYQKQFRPTLLSAGQVIDAFLRGDYDGSEVAEELSRLGYSDKRQDMLLKSAYKRLSLADTMTMLRDGQVGRDFVIENLRAQGYDQATAEAAIVADETKHHLAIQDDSLAAVRSAYVERRITDGEFSQYLEAIVPFEDDRAAIEIAARTIRDVNTKRLSVSQAEACVKAQILPIASYREALRYEGYDVEAALSLELLLEKEMNADLDVAKARKEKADAAAAAKAQAAADKAAKQAAVEQERALNRRGPVSELVRAVVRGLIPTGRLTEVLAQQYDADTVQIYVADAEQQRADYLAQQQKADDATKRATVRHIDVGQLEQAVLNDVLTPAQFRRQLDTLAFSPDDADVLTATITAKKADQDAAKAKRAAADSAAKAKSIDLSRFEQLVRRGARTMADYSALLVSLGFDDASVAAMAELLQLKIAGDNTAAQTRAGIAAADPNRGLTLEQFRRAVIIGAKTVDDFSNWLVQNRYTTDAAAVLVAELQDDVDQADAARRKREQAGAARGPAALSLATAARAARLGLISPAEYRDRLTAAGYTADDIAIEMDLLVAEIGDVQAARAKQGKADSDNPTQGLTLSQLATAVKAGEAPIEAYSARAHDFGLSDDDVDLLTRVLLDELQAKTPNAG
jgi:hypothetical protein